MKRLSSEDRPVTGQMKTILGNYVDLNDPDPETFDIADVAWSLSKLNRFNGHAIMDWTVAHHCIVMSYYVGNNHQLEALLHDAAEAYIGDIIFPVKAVLDAKFDGAISDFENTFLAKLIDTLAPEDHPIRDTIKTGIYVKSDTVRKADLAMAKHEWAMLKRGPEHEENPHIQRAIDRAVDAHFGEFFEETEGNATFAYLSRFAQLTKQDFDVNEAVALFFPPTDDPIAEALEQVNGERMEAGLPLLDRDEYLTILEKAEEVTNDMTKEFASNA